MSNFPAIGVLNRLRVTTHGYAYQSACTYPEHPNGNLNHREGDARDHRNTDLCVLTALCSSRMHRKLLTVR